MTDLANRPMAKTVALPAYERLHELFEIVPIAESQFGTHSGLIRKVSRGGQRRGSVAGHPRPNSRCPDRIDWVVSVDDTDYLVSRILFVMDQGYDPGELTVDHRDRNPLNNNVGNLRLADHVLQNNNQKQQSNNTSGVTGVSWDKRKKKWRVMLSYDGRNRHLGYYTCSIEAACVYNDKVIELGLDKLGKPLNDLDAL